MTKDLGRSSWVDVEDWIPFKWVRFLRLRAIDRQASSRVIQSSRAESAFRWLKYTGINLENKAMLDYSRYLQRKKTKTKRKRKQ